MDKATDEALDEVRRAINYADWDTLDAIRFAAERLADSARERMKELYHIEDAFDPRTLLYEHHEEV
jgi:hypothetical protein